MKTYEDLIELKKRFNWVIAPRYETLLYQPSLGVEFQLTTVTDQTEGHPHRLEIRVKDFPLREIEFKDIFPLQVIPYITRREALDDHDLAVESLLNLLGRYNLGGR